MPSKQSKKKVTKKVNKKRSEAAKKAWRTRRKNYNNSFGSRLQPLFEIFGPFSTTFKKS